MKQRITVKEDMFFLNLILICNIIIVNRSSIKCLKLFQVFVIEMPTTLIRHHKMKLVMIGKAKKPRLFKGTESKKYLLFISVKIGHR